MEMWQVLLCAVSLFLCIITQWVYNWRNPKCNGKLPPGSMGLPFIGETLQFFAPHSGRDISPFIKNRMNWYGSLFKTALVGTPLIISTDPQFNRYIFQQEGKLFQCWYMDTFSDIFGPENVLTQSGSLHKYLRNLILTIFGSENLKETFLPEVEELALTRLQSWASQPIIEIKEAIATMVFDFAAKKIIGYEESKTPEKLKENYSAFIDGLISFPLNIPGTAYYKCIQGRKKAVNIVKNIFEERRASSQPKKKQKDFLDLVLEEMKRDDTTLKEATVLDLLFVLPFATYETVSSALTLAIKYLSDHPLALKELTKEQEAVLKARQTKESGITWEEYKSMTFTIMVINETVRLANIVPGIFRKAMKDIEIKGYTIPQGWIVMVCPPAVHMSPEMYDDPLAFNPWRWQGQELNAGSQKFMAFGGGIRLCAGAEFAKLLMATFLHHLVTKYRWTVIKGGDYVKKPGLVFPNGFHVQIVEKNK